MAPIPVYTDSPISAAKPSGVTPRTAAPAEHSPPAPKPAAASPTSPTQASSYPPARPGAVPSLPTPTSTYTATADPSPPQPGPVPATVPPPPKVGEKYQHPQPTPAPQLVTMPYPHQMSIPSPTSSYPSQQRGTATATTTAPASLYGKQPTTNLGGGQDAQNLQHPPGYQQNTDASELDKYQRSAMRQNELETHAAGDSEGIWGAARKLAQQTGEKLVAAENEVWKKINKE